MFDVVVQSTHLKTYNASFAEKFYGLERRSLQNDSLTPRHLLASLIFLSAYPYVRRKLDNKYGDLKRLDAETGIRRDSKDYCFLKLYPAVCLIYESCNLILQVRYTMGQASQHSLLLKLASVRLRTYSKSETQSSNGVPSTSLWESVASRWLARGLGAGLTGGAFFLQFLDFFYSREETASVSLSPIPSAPKREAQVRIVQDMSCQLSANYNASLIYSFFAQYSLSLILTLFSGDFPRRQSVSIVP